MALNPPWIDEIDEFLISTYGYAQGLNADWVNRAWKIEDRVGGEWYEGYFLFEEDYDNEYVLIYRVVDAQTDEYIDTVIETWYLTTPSDFKRMKKDITELT